MQSNDLKKIVVGTSIHSESYDLCLVCCTQTPIGSLNLVHGTCGACSPRRNNKELLKQMIKLTEAMENDNG